MASLSGVRGGESARSSKKATQSLPKAAINCAIALSVLSLTPERLPKERGLGERKEVGPHLDDETMWKEPERADNRTRSVAARRPLPH